MNHSKRLAQLEAKTPSAIEQMTVKWMTPTADDATECFIFWRDGQKFHRADDETEAEFLERVGA